MSKRPEHQAPPDMFYNEEEAKKYTQNSRVMEIQGEMTERCVELLALDGAPRLLLDVGCGSGLSGRVLEHYGHAWLGLDISTAMLDVAIKRCSAARSEDDDEDDDEDEEGSGAGRGWCGGLVRADMGEGLCWRAGCFDGAVSVSALQWLFTADSARHNPVQRLNRFFATLYAALSRGARAALQFYPESEAQVELATAAATRAGFHGGLLVDFPNSAKAKKLYLVLMTGGPAPLPQPLGVAQDKTQVLYARREAGRAAREAARGGRAWLLAKKERRRRQGKDTRPDSKYTGRKRPARF